MENYPNINKDLIKIFFIISAIIVSLLLMNCSRMSEIINDPKAGFNGSFEITKSGLPVNWYVYSPSTIPSGDYNLIFDLSDKIEGNQSLKFIVRECVPTGGWLSPGCFQTIPAITGNSYKVSFWLKNQGCEFNLSIGSERVREPGRHIGKIFKNDDATDTWQQFEYVYAVPQGFENIRFELNILKPGILCIDDVKIEEIK